MTEGSASRDRTTDQRSKGEESIPRQTKARKQFLDIVSLATSALEDGKAEDVVTIDLAGKTTFADHMIICSGQSQRQVTALADRMVDAVKEAGFAVNGIEGYDAGDWVLVDLGDVVVHVFRAEIRDLYNLEKMWSMPMPVPIEATA